MMIMIFTTSTQCRSWSFSAIFAKCASFKAFRLIVCCFSLRLKMLKHHIKCCRNTLSSKIDWYFCCRKRECNKYSYFIGHTWPWGLWQDVFSSTFSIINQCVKILNNAIIGKIICRWQHKRFLLMMRAFWLCLFLVDMPNYFKQDIKMVFENPESSHISHIEMSDKASVLTFNIPI